MSNDLEGADEVRAALRDVLKLADHYGLEVVQFPDCLTRVMEVRKKPFSDLGPGCSVLPKPAPLVRRVRDAAVTIAKMWRQDVERSQEIKDPWYKRGEIQALRDSLETMRRSGILTKYSTDKLVFRGGHEVDLAKTPLPEPLPKPPPQSLSLGDILAKICYLAQGHVSGPNAWSQSPDDRQQYLAATSYTVSCFLAQYTVDGVNGVEWDVVLKDLVGRTVDENIWGSRLDRIIEGLGGVMTDDA